MAKHMFVDNARLTEEYREYRKLPEAIAYFEARDKHRSDKENGVPNGHFKLKPPPLPKYIGESIFKIATSFGTKPNYRHLANIDEMVSQAVIIALSYGHNFNPELGTSAFGYLTMIIDRAFIAGIHQTRHQAKINREIIMRASTGQIDSFAGGSDSGVAMTTHVGLMAKHYDDMAVLERDTKVERPKKTKKPPKEKPTTASLEDIFDE